MFRSSFSSRFLGGLTISSESEKNELELSLATVTVLFAGLASFFIGVLFGLTDSCFTGLIGVVFLASLLYYILVGLLIGEH